MRRDTVDAPGAVKVMNWCNGGDSSCTTGSPEVVFDYFTRLRQIYCQETGACVP